MFMDTKQLRELFESSGNDLRFNWSEDYQKLSHYLAADKVKAEQVNLTADPRGIFAKLLEFFASQRTWDEISVVRAIPALRSITKELSLRSER